MIELIIAAIVGTSAAFAGQTGADAESTVYCRHRGFRIPVELSPAERSNIAGIRVFVSTDEGRTWTKHADAPPDAKTVTFRSVRDATYWFALCVVQKDGSQTPAETNIAEPGLKVVVDTAQPALLIKPVRSTSGKRGVRWEINDDHLDIETLQIAYWTDSANAWKSMPIQDRSKSIQWFEDGVEVQKLQASVFDRAGNETVQEVEIAGDRFTKSPVSSFALSSPKNSETAPKPAAMPPMQSPGTPATASPTTSPAVAASTSSALPPATKPMLPPPAAIPGKSPMADSPVKASAPPTAEKPWAPPIQPASHAQNTSHTAFSPVRPAAGKTREHMICGNEPIVVNYEIDRTPGGPPQKVELWGTRDRGASWTRLAVDVDGVSPVEAALPNDGVWGLKIVTRPASAPPGSETGPKPGSQPDTYVESDRLAPAVMVGVPEIQGEQVIIRWEANDKNLASNCVSIYFSHGPKGPWTEVAKNVDNAGEFAWNYVRSQASGNVYFRVEVTDEAKNVGVAESPVSVQLGAGAAPKSRVLQVQPRSGN